MSWFAVDFRRATNRQGRVLIAKAIQFAWCGQKCEPWRHTMDGQLYFLLRLPVLVNLKNDVCKSAPLRRSARCFPAHGNGTSVGTKPETIRLPSCNSASAPMMPMKGSSFPLASGSMNSCAKPNSTTNASLPTDAFQHLLQYYLRAEWAWLQGKYADVTGSEQQSVVSSGGECAMTLCRFKWLNSRAIGSRPGERFKRNCSSNFLVDVELVRQ